MDVSLEHGVNRTNSTPVLRGAANSTVAQAPPAYDRSTLEYVFGAIRVGDNLPNTDAGLRARVQRRALIVAPQYQVHFENYGHLPATLNDVCRMHKMLKQCGYEEANIRILVDGLATDPTSDNVLESLKWLVSNVQPGNYRFFHFSGHGTHILSTKDKGKEALKIPEKRSNSLPLDHELSASSKQQYERVSELSAPKQEITYYNEAIITTFKPVPLLESLTKDVTEYNMIRDSVLNEYFSQLPENSRLTCTLDVCDFIEQTLRQANMQVLQCCHSGRMLNNNFKLAGAGFRGRSVYSSAQGNAPKEPMGDFTRMDDLMEQHNKQANQNPFPQYSFNTANASIPADSTSLSPDTSTAQTLPVERGKPAPAVAASAPPMAHNYTSPPLVSKMTELLPAEEASRDKIKADMLTWSGCHQRQAAVDYTDSRGGLFTRVSTWYAVYNVPRLLIVFKPLRIQSFAETVMSNISPVSVGQLYEKLNQRIAEEARIFPGGVLQYAQVWTSCKNGNEEQAKAKLFKDFDI
ncbi:hypothetical protein FRC12_002325 [Ceratobasidium sp. 428]|nr:hypothetical protein FRC12_002325 [Ceratobasidium sp. 428]